MSMVANFILSFCTISSLLSPIRANVIGLDFGSDSMKVALVQPGAPLEIVTNFQSKRKTPTSISFYRNERQFGSDSIALLARKPDAVYPKMYRMLGRTPENPLIKELVKQYFPHEFYINSTTGLTCVKQDETYYTPEELLAMMMQYAKDMTVNYGGKLIKDCVITVPSHFTQHERNALYTAADIADLRVLSLIEENTAAALHYGIDRVFEKPNTILYYNMGSSSVQVTVATYASYVVKEAGKNKSIGQFEVVGKAWDRSLGGFNFEVQLTELLADRFNEIWSKKASGKGKDIREFLRPMTRLRSEANKIKEVLSANLEFPVKAEQLHADTDLSTKVTRADFEEACKDLLARVTLPIDRALAMANLTLSDIDSVELLGGSVRIPRVKKILEDYFKASKLELGQHLNGDEAMALGAAFRAANLSTAFRVRKVGMSDINSFGISLRLETLLKNKEATGKAAGFFVGVLGKNVGQSLEETGEMWSKYTEIYAPKSTLSSKLKAVTFPYDRDILCRIEYTDSDTSLVPEGTEPFLAVFNITGISDFAAETASKYPNASSPKVHLSFSLDGSGVVALVRAEVTSELAPEPEPEPEHKPVTNATDAAAKTEVADADPNAPAVDANSTETDANNTSTSSSKKKKSDKTNNTDKKKDAKKLKEKKDNTLRRVLTVTPDYKAIKPAAWSPAAIAEARQRLRALHDTDLARQAKEAALNELEAYIYKVKNRLSDEEDALKAVSTDEQRQAVVDAANAAEEWLYEDGRNAGVSTYAAKQKSIHVLADAIFSRHSELTDRPAAVAKAHAAIADLKATVTSWAEKKPYITEADLAPLHEAVAEALKWLEDKQQEQLQKSAFESPAFLSEEVPLHFKTVGGIFDRLSKKPKPLPHKVNVTEASSVNSTNGTAANETVKVNITETASESAAASEKSKTTGDEL